MLSGSRKKVPYKEPYKLLGFGWIVSNFAGGANLSKSIKTNR
jgi:hypothetical protein